MKTAATILISVLVGLCIGWYSYSTKVSAKYLRIMQKSGVTEEQMVETYKKLPAVMDNMESEDRMTTAVSLAALRLIESNNLEEAKQLLAKQPASYYVIYGPLDNPRKKMTEERKSTLEAIQKARQQSPVLEAAIADSIRNVNE